MGRKFSVIVPVYNVEKFLDKCIKSVLAQTYYNFELILVDNNSTDGSRAICDKYAKIDERIKVIEAKKQGLSCARNVGLDVATGDYVCFIDSDDYIIKEHLMKNAYQLDKGYDICSFCAIREDEDYNYLYEMRFHECIKDFDFNKTEKRKMICNTFFQYKAGWEAWISTYKMSLLKENNIRFDEDLKYAEDFPFTAKCMIHADKWVKIPDVLYGYLMRKGSLTADMKHEAEMDKISEELEKLSRSIVSFTKEFDNISAMLYYTSFMYFEKNELYKMISIEQYRDILLKTTPIVNGQISLKDILLIKDLLIEYFGDEKGNDIYKTFLYVYDGNMDTYTKKSGKRRLFGLKRK